MKRLLIIKTGRTESFADSESREPSLGDVLRTTVLLHAFEGYEITWVTSRAAMPLLARNPRVHRLVPESEARLRGFDTIVNLERSEPWLSRVREADARVKLGFGHEPSTEIPGALWQEKLFALVKRRWSGEEYVYVAPTCPAPNHDVIGLNWSVGSKWPSKAWPLEKWRELSDQLARSHRVSWQRGLTSLDEYAAWIQSCAVIVTQDSLGLHLALAMRKRAVVLYGPTSPTQVFLYGLGVAVAPSRVAHPCSPCLLPVCSRPVSCMDELAVEVVAREIRETLRSPPQGSSIREGVHSTSRAV